LINRIPEWLLFLSKQLVHAKGAAALVTVLTIGAACCGAITPIVIGKLIAAITANAAEAAELGGLALLLLVSLLLTDVLSAVRSYVSTQAMLEMTSELIRQSLASVLHTSADFFRKTPRGELLQRCLQDTRVIQQFGLFTVPQFIQELLLACIALTVISRIYWPVAVMIGGCYGLLFIPVFVLGRKRGESRRKLVAHEAVVRQSLLEKLESIKQIRLFGMEKQEHARVRSEQEKWAELSFEEEIVTNTYKGFPRIPDAMAPAIVFLFVGWQVVSGQTSLAELLMIIAFIPALNAPVRSVFQMAVTLTDIRLRIQGVLDYLRLPAEPGRADGLEMAAGCDMHPIVFKNVSVFGDRGPILHNVTFTVQPGKHIAIVGPSGAGKSTLLQLLVRLKEPSSGGIDFCGKPLSRLDVSGLRQEIGYVTQESVLLRDTIRSNLTLLNQAEETELDRWMHAFGADDIVAGREGGYEAEVGDRGCTLSGGQRQLIALVRTMLKRPRLLLLDEATASLDPLSENRVYEALDANDTGITRICVTHRLRSAVRADRIIVLDRGRIVQQGTHEALVCQTHGLYAQLWSSEQEADAAQVMEQSRKQGGSEIVAAAGH
jgi:ATP-binding cassette subfamily B protein